MSKDSSKPALRLGGGTLSALLGFGASYVIETPYGYAESMFRWIALLGAFSGFEIGTFLGEWNRRVTGTFSVFAAVSAFLLYYWTVSNFVGGFIPGLFVPILYALAFIALFVGCGIFGLQVF